MWFCSGLGDGSVRKTRLVISLKNCLGEKQNFSVLFAVYKPYLYCELPSAI